MAFRGPFVLAAVVAGAFGAAALLVPHSPAELRELVLAAGSLAPVIALLAWIVLTPAMFPGTVLAAASGLAFGTPIGAALALVGATLGGLAAFTLGRKAAPGAVARLLARRERLRAKLDRLLERSGFAAVLAARLMPGMPAGALNYAAALSPVRPRAFAGAIAIGALLRTVPYAILGQGLAVGSEGTIAIAGGSILLGALGTALLIRAIRAAQTA